MTDYVQRLVDLGFEIDIRPQWLGQKKVYLGVAKPSKRVEFFASGEEKVNKLARKVFENVCQKPV